METQLGPPGRLNLRPHRNLFRQKNSTSRKDFLDDYHEKRRRPFHEVTTPPWTRHVDHTCHLDYL